MNEADAIAAEVLKCLSEPLVGEPILEIVESKCAENEKYGPLIMCIEDHKRPPTKMVLLCDLVKGGHEFVHEVFGSFNEWLRPYGDFEMYFNTEAEMEAKKWPLWELCLKNIRRRVGDLATIRGFEACGYKADKKKWVVSFHYTIQGVGAFECGMDIMRAGYVPNEEGFDQSPYREPGARQTMRMPGMSKTGENRPFKFIGGVEGQWVSIDIWKLPEHQRRAILTVGLAQMICDEKRRDVPRSGEMLIGDEVVALGTNGLPLGEDIKITAVAQIERLAEIAGWMGEVNRDYDTYCEEIWTLRNTADQYKLDIEEMRALAQKVAAVCPNNNPDHVNSLFNASGGRSTCQRRRLIAHLRKAAKEKNAEAYAEWIKPLREAQKIDDLKEFKNKLSCRLTKELDWNNGIIMQQKDVIMSAADEWMEKMFDAERSEKRIMHETTLRMDRMRAAHLPVNRRFVISDKKIFHNALIVGTNLLEQFTNDTMMAVINGGETIWITADFVESHGTTYIKELPVCPMSHKTETIWVNCVNKDWPAAVMDCAKKYSADLMQFINEMNKAVYERISLSKYAQEYRKTHFSQLAGHFPYLTEEQKPKPSEVFNRFGGFRYQYEPRKTKFKFDDYPREIEPFIKHIYNVMANGNRHIGNYLLVWFAFLLQFPARKPEMCLFLISIEGAGKGIVFESFAKYVMGEDHFLALRKLDDLIGHFNAHLEGKRLVTIGETKDGDLANKETHRALKNIITDERMVFVGKGKDSRTAMDYGAFVIFGNHASAISLDTGDRRIYPIQMSNEMIGNVPYFDALSDNMKDHGYLIFDFLANLDLTGYNVRQPAIAHGERVADNQFRMQLVEDSLSEPLQWLISIAQHEQKCKFIGGQPIDLPERANAELKCQQSELYAAYCDWYKEKHHGEVKFLCKMRTMLIEVEKLGIKNEKRQWVDENGDRIRKWCYTLTFSSVRDGFRALLKNPNYDF